MNELRPELPTPPARIARLPIDERGYPVPFFVQWVKDGEPVPPGEGVPDHRIMDPTKMPRALRERLCWICGDKLGKYHTYSIGPMCAINRTISEPGSHLECARYATQACPFMARPHARRREAGRPETAVDAAGVHLHRNPGVMLLWTTTTPAKPYRTYGDGVSRDGILFDLPAPESVEAWCEGRKATWDEVAESIRSGLPLLLDSAKAPEAEREKFMKLATERTGLLEMWLKGIAA